MPGLKALKDFFELEIRISRLLTYRMVCPKGTPPVTTLRLISLRQIRVLEGGVYPVLLRRPYELFCAAILLCDLSRLAARALTSHRAKALSVGPFSRQTHRTVLEN